MKNALLIACAIAAIAAGASTASAGEYRAPAATGGLFVRVDDHMRYDSSDYGYDNGYADNGYYGSGGYYGSNGGYYGSNGGYYAGNGYGSGYRYSDGGYHMLPPNAVARNLYRSGFSSISQPVFDGQYYQVKARDPGGRKVKLYVDAMNGQIVRVKH